jgi:hypothetical protein
MLKNLLSIQNAKGPVVLEPASSPMLALQEATANAEPGGGNNQCPMKKDGDGASNFTV